MNRCDISNQPPTLKTCLLFATLVAACFSPWPGFSAQSLTDGTFPSEPTLADDITRAFYRDRGDRPAWSDDSLFAQLLDALEQLSEHGLDPSHYHLPQLQLWRTEAEQREHYATDAWFAAAGHMLSGKLDPVTVEPDWTARGREADLAGSLQQALEEQTVTSSLEQFAPVQPEYRRLQAELRNLQRQQAEPVLAVPAGPLLRQGMSGERVLDLQQRLNQLELLSPDYQPGLMDEATVEAIQLFQSMQNLDDDGVVGPATLNALNRGLGEKLDQLRVNLERWRWLPDNLGQRHVRVNIAGFSVTTWENGEPLRSHLAIVGKTYRKTPVFSDQIEYLIFNPWWEIPPSIAKADKLPLFRNEPGLVRELGFRVLDNSGRELDPDGIDWNQVTRGNFSYRLRQEPGLNNALGQVKIMFPNVHNVYLHDTPTRGLFQQQQRAFSSGCIRTQFPLELAAWLLEETPGWDLDRIHAAVESGQETRVNLASRVPVHVLYFTVVAQEHGGVRYLDDLYERDEAVLSGLQKNFTQ